MEQPPTADSMGVATMLASYRQQAGSFDEAFTTDGKPRPAWSKFLESLGKLKESDLVSRHDSANRLLREHGATYTIYNQEQC